MKILHFPVLYLYIHVFPFRRWVRCTHVICFHSSLSYNWSLFCVGTVQLGILSVTAVRESGSKSRNFCHSTWPWDFLDFGRKWPNPVVQSTIPALFFVCCPSPWDKEITPTARQTYYTGHQTTLTNPWVLILQRAWIQWCLAAHSWLCSDAELWFFESRRMPLWQSCLSLYHLLGSMRRLKHRLLSATNPDSVTLVVAGNFIAWLFVDWGLRPGQNLWQTKNSSHQVLPLCMAHSFWSEVVSEKLA